MWVNLSEIQPGEEYLKKSVVDYFLQNPENVWAVNQTIRIGQSSGYPFRYHAINGNNRMYVLMKLGVGAINIDVKATSPEDHHLTIFKRGIRSFMDLEERIVADELYDKMSKSGIWDVNQWR